MFQPPPDFEVVLSTQHRKACRESRLVLDAIGIASDAVHHKGWWYLLVARNDLELATSELEEYHRENADRAVGTTDAMPLYRGAVSAILVYAGVILLTAFFDWRWDLVPAGRMQAGRVLDGEVWRTITALTLHLDAQHLLSNLVFGVVFGLLAGKVLGGGLAWLSIVIAGALGNFTNALVRNPEHASIGASTAVFAALGVVVANALRPSAFAHERPMKRWSPLIGGVVLFAFTGVGGERTDVVAHATGFLAGMLIGWAGGRLPSRWLASDKIQTWAGGATVAIILAAWIVAITVAGR